MCTIYEVFASLHFIWCCSLSLLLRLPPSPSQACRHSGVGGRLAKRAVRSVHKVAANARTRDFAAKSLRVGESVRFSDRSQPKRPALHAMLAKYLKCPTTAGGGIFKTALACVCGWHVRLYTICLAYLVELFHIFFSAFVAGRGGFVRLVWQYLQSKPNRSILKSHFSRISTATSSPSSHIARPYVFIVRISSGSSGNLCTFASN